MKVTIEITGELDTYDLEEFLDEAVRVARAHLGTGYCLVERTFEHPYRVNVEARIRVERRPSIVRTEERT